MSTTRSYVKMDSKVEQTVLFLKANSPATAKEIGITLVDLKSMLSAEKPLVQQVGVRKHANGEQAGRGRPMFEFKLTRAGSDKARRIANKAASVEQTVAA